MDLLLHMLGNFFRRSAEYKQRVNENITLKATVLPQAEAKENTWNTVAIPWPRFHVLRSILIASLLIFC